MGAKRFIDDPALDIMGSYSHDASYLTPNPIDMDGLYIQVHRAGAVSQLEKDFRVERDDSYAYNVIHCLFRGKGTLTVRGKTYELVRGQLFILASNESHLYSTDPDNPMGVVWVEFAGGSSAQFAKHILDMGGPVYSGSVFTKVTDLCTSILYQPSLQNRIPQVSAILYQMLMHLCAHVESGVKLEPMVQSILKYIEENINRRLSLTEVSAVFGYHPAYFSSRFAKDVGVTFSKYVMQRKMSHACHLLETTAWSVDRIAHELGFCDISHFIQRFKALEGKTPMVYRSHSEGSRKKESPRYSEPKNDEPQIRR